MPDVLKGFLTVVLSLLFFGVAGLLVGVGVANVVPWLIVGLVLGLIYGLFAGVLLAYDLGSGLGWLQLLVDFTWSLPNTLFGTVIGIPLYLFFGNPSKAESEGQGWIAFMPRGSGAFGNQVLQTLGTVNLGGAGQHERMHLLQARIFGPIYLPFFALNYVLTFLTQVLFTATLGLLLWALGARDTPYFRPPSSSAVSGFFGWIYYANVLELWAYASGNP